MLTNGVKYTVISKMLYKNTKNVIYYNRKQHKPWNEYLNDINEFVKENNKDSNEDNDLDWLNDL